MFVSGELDGWFVIFRWHPPETNARFVNDVQGELCEEALSFWR